MSDMKKLLESMDKFSTDEVYESVIELDEDDIEEGNEFTKALADARAAGKKEFEVDGKTYKVNESLEEAILSHLAKRGYDTTVTEAEYQGRKVKLNKPMAGDVKKFKVYVKDPKTGNVKKVNFGQKGVKIKKNNPERRKSFRARHNCDQKKDKTTAGYWSCRKW